MLFFRPGPAKTAVVLLVGIGLAVPATWIQLQLLIPELLRPSGGVEAAIFIWQYLRDLHAGPAVLAIPGLVFLGLVILPAIKLVREDGDAGRVSSSFSPGRGCWPFLRCRKLFSQRLSRVRFMG